MEAESILKMDPNILLSTINMKLRDEFSNLEELCGYYNINESGLREKLYNIGFEYVEEVNQFK